MKNQETLFEISFLFKADSQTVYGMWVNPDNFSKWLGPEGAEMDFIKDDVNEGETAQWSMTTTDGLTKYGQLNYKIINPNFLLVYTQNFCDLDGNFIKAPFSDTYPDYLLTTVHFMKEGHNKTTVSVKWEIFGESSERERQTFLAMKEIMREGWTASFKKLESLLS